MINIGKKYSNSKFQQPIIPNTQNYDDLLLAMLQEQGMDDNAILDILNDPVQKAAYLKKLSPHTQNLNTATAAAANAATNVPTEQAVKDAAAGGTKGLFAKLTGGTMKKDFHFPNFRQGFGGANLGYSLGPSYYANDAQRFLTPDEIKLFDAGQSINGIDSSQVMKTSGGLKLGGYNVGKLWTGGQAAMNLVKGVKNLDNLSKASEQGSDLRSDILATAASTPNVSSYLSADEQRMLNQLKRGNYYEDDWGTDASDWGGVLGGGIKGAISGLPGGAVGAVLGGIGGAINGGLSSATKKKENYNSKLDALYNTLSYARNDYNSMKRPNFSGLGVQQRFSNAYM